MERKLILKKELNPMWAKTLSLTIMFIQCQLMLIEPIGWYDKKDFDGSGVKVPKPMMSSGSYARDLEKQTRDISPCLGESGKGLGHLSIWYGSFDHREDLTSMRKSLTLAGLIF